MVWNDMSLSIDKKKIEDVVISGHSRFTSKLYHILKLSVKWLISVMSNAINVLGKKGLKAPGVVNQVTNRGGTILCF